VVAQLTGTTQQVHVPHVQKIERPVGQNKRHDVRFQTAMIAL
jgi:hypothetical protein